MVYRIYVEKKPELAHEARALLSDAVNLLGIAALENVRILNRYDAEGIDEELFSYAVNTVFSEPQLDIVSETLDANGGTVFAVEYLPGQFDQRADSAAQCIQIISCGICFIYPQIKGLRYTERLFLHNGRHRVGYLLPP